MHRRYAGRVHARTKRTGHFWQGRFGCVTMDAAHLGAPVRERFPDFADLLAVDEDEAMSQRLRRAESTGRSVGDDHFLVRIERRTARTLKPGKRSPKPKD